MQLNIFLFLSLYNVPTYADEYPAVLDNPFRQGILLKPEGYFWPLAGTWQMVVEYKITSIINTITELESAFGRINEIGKGTKAKLIINTQKHITKSINDFKTEYKRLEETITYENPDFITTNRTKRGLPDGVSHFLGVATTTDIRHIIKKAKEAMKAEQDLTHHVEQQITFLKSTSGQLNGEQNQVLGLMNITSDLENTIQVLATQGKEGSMTQLAAYKNVIDTIERLHNHITQLFNAITTLWQHHIPQNLISQQTLTSTILNIQEVNKHQLIPAYGGKETIRYYSMPIAIGLHYSEHIRAIIQIPLIEEGQQFYRYMALPFPHTVQTNNGSHRVQWTGKPTRIALDRKRSQVINPAPPDINSRCWPGPKPICSIFEPVYTYKYDDCLTAMLLKNQTRLTAGNNKAVDSCDMTVLPHQKPVVENWTPSVWAISVATQTPAKEICTKDNKATEMSVTLEREGLISIKENCRLVTDAFQLTAVKHFRGTSINADDPGGTYESEDLQMLVDGLRQQQTLSEHLLRDREKLKTLIDQSKVDYNLTGMLTQLMQQDLDKLKDYDDRHKNMSDDLDLQEQHFISLWAVLGILIIAGVLTFIYCKCSKRRQEHKLTTAVNDLAMEEGVNETDTTEFYGTNPTGRRSSRLSNK